MTQRKSSKKDNITSLVPQEVIANKIFVIRGKKVMLDRDLAELYGVQTKRINEQVKRNIERFPDDFMFQLTKEEFKILKSQIATSSWGGVRKLPYAFTEHGTLMLANVLKSPIAIEMSIVIIKTFTKLREMLTTHTDLKKKIEDMEEKYDKQFKIVFDAIKLLLEPPDKPEKEIGFRRE
jgi:phage regulator Rha-like protein